MPTGEPYVTLPTLPEPTLAGAEAMTRRLALTIAVLSLVPINSASAQKKNPAGTRVLLLSGGQREHHGYRDQAYALARTLEETGNYRVTIVEDAGVLESSSLGKYDMIILTADRRDDEFKFSQAQQRALLDFVKAGHGFVSIHGADNAAKDWLPEWREMLGGVFTHVGLPDGKVKKGSYTVRIADSSSPVARGLSDFPLKDELYYQMQMQPDVRPIATVDHEGGTWPVAWTRTFGSGRVFHTPLGHRDFGPDKVDPLRDPNLARLLLQGIDWAAGR